MDWHPATTDAVTWRYNRQDSTAFNAGVGGLSTVEHGRSSRDDYWGVAAAWTRIAGAGAANEMRGVFNRARPQGFVNAGPTFEIQRPTGVLGAPPNHGLIGEEWIQFIDNLTLARGAHTAKIGVTYSNIRFFGDFRNLRDGQYLFTTDRPLDLSDPSTHPLQFIALEGGTAWDERANVVGLFAQDDWRVTPRFTVSYGIRYDSDDSLAISGARRVHTLSPRLGIAWALDRRARTMLRASAGILHDSEHTNLATIFILNNLLVDRAVVLSGNPAFGGAFNPFLDPADPIGSDARLRAVLAEAFAAGRTPDLDALDVPGFARSVDAIDPDFTVPENRQVVLGVSRALTPHMAVAADLVYSRAQSLLVWRERNLSREGARIDPDFGSKSVADSTGTARYRALALRWDMRRPGHHAGLSYTWARCDDDTSGILSGNSATNPFDLEVDAGPCDTDTRHTLVVRGGTRLPFGIEVSTIFNARSALPYSAVTSDPLPLFTRYEPRNRRRGDSFLSWDVRVGRTTSVTDRLSATLFLESFNVLDHTNISTFVSNASSPQFGQAAEASEPRRLQLGVRFDF